MNFLPASVAKLQESDRQHIWLNAVFVKPRLIDHSVGVSMGVKQPSGVEQFLFTTNTGIELINATGNQISTVIRLYLWNIAVIPS